MSNCSYLTRLSRKVNSKTKYVKKLLPCNGNSVIGGPNNRFSKIYVKEAHISNSSIHFNNGVSLRTDENCNLLAKDIDGNEFIIPTTSYLDEMSKSVREQKLKSDLEGKYSLLKTYFTNLKNSYLGDSENKVTELSNADFKMGTYVIDTPGLYRLSEDIVFNPNNLAFLNSTEDSDAITLRSANGLSLPVTAYNTGDVLPSQFGQYDPSAFGLGFFCAISIKVENVIIDLNGYTISQSPEHALQQRFFSVFELADQPFIPTQGPHSFGPSIESATNCYIHNGTIGLSSHHGIHGNENKNIMLEDVNFTNYEVGACSLNKVEGLYCKNVHGLRNRQDIPVLGNWSSARFIRPYINALYNNGVDSWSGTINGKDIATIHGALKGAIENVYDQVLVSATWGSSGGSSEYKLFGNASGLIDGNSYGFLVNTGGVAVMGFPDSRLTASKDIYFNNVTVSNQLANINEIPALTLDNGENKQMNDPIGSVFQTVNREGQLSNGAYLTINNDNTYKGNVVSDAQLAVVKAIADGFNFGHLSTTRNSIDTSIVDWANGQTTWSSLNIKYLGNGDSMFHVNKGVVIFKMDASENVYMENCNCYLVKNTGLMGSNLANDNVVYKNKMGVSHPNATYYGYGGSNVRGYSFCTTKNTYVYQCSVRDIESSYGYVYGYDVHRNSVDATIEEAEVMKLVSGSEAKIDDYNNNPTPLPISVGFHVERLASNVEIIKPSVTELTSAYNTYECLKENS